jgi:AAA+ superfamily predicted ATPase
MDSRKVSQMGMVVERKEELIGHERTKQKAKVEITSLQPNKAFGRWFFERWC